MWKSFLSPMPDTQYLTDEQLLALTPQRRYALLKMVKARVGKYLDHYFDFEPDMLGREAKKLNDYRKKIQKLVDKHGRKNPPKKQKR